MERTAEDNDVEPNVKRISELDQQGASLLQ
jgi:hypothetical protein